ncbi:MAG TPA: TIGR03667 family PPOX class F420-dependent oxidoreductase [Jatrophihabitans sp.]|uniref:TIGR03667 family PPOX class F420-dependent oxidoreductase n=1 Tax=Jatrophihabitans sp. TaxID=1932789 RepID=UPI002E07BBAD|nr:TIGR03667 family PPOX class F420-dependent oxidoreductase [Jatrophihabitans sp.]
MIPDGEFGERVAARLRDEMVVWLTTVGADGTPQPNPVWFLWDGDATLLIYNRPDALRLGHIDARPTVALNFDGNGRGGDIVVLSGTARRVPATAPAHENAAYVAKYAEAMTRVSGSPAEFAVAYPVAVAIDVRRVRGH